MGSRLKRRSSVGLRDRTDSLTAAEPQTPELFTQVDLSFLFDSFTSAYVMLVKGWMRKYFCIPF